MKFRTAIFFPIFLLFLFSACAHRSPGHTRKHNHDFSSEAALENPRPKYHEEKVSFKGNRYYYYLLAKLNAFEGNQEFALEDLKRTVEVDPQSSFLREELARGNIEANRIEEALGAVREAIRLDPKNQSAHLTLGKLYSARKETALAIEEYQKAIQLNPKDEEAHVSLAREYLGQDKIDRGIEVLQRLKKEVPTSTTGSFLLATVYSGFKKDAPRAIVLYEQVLYDNPDDVRTLQALGQLYLDQKRLKDAERIYQELNKILPEDLATSLRLGLLSYEKQDYPSAIHFFKKILEKNPQSDRTQYYLGVTYQAQKDYPAALDSLSQVSEDSPFYKDAILHRIIIHEDQHQIEEALVLIQKAVVLRGDVPEFYAVWAALYNSGKKYDQAIEVLNRAIQKYPKDERLLFSLGATYDKKGDSSQGLKTMLSLLALNPKNVGAMNYVGYSYADQGIHLEDALKLVSQAVLLKPKDGYILDSLGWVYFKKGETHRALGFLLKAIELVPNEPIVLEHLGDVYLKLGNPQKALGYYERAQINLESHPDKDFADQRDLGRIQKKLGQLRNGN